MWGGLTCSRDDEIQPSGPSPPNLFVVKAWLFLVYMCWKILHTLMGIHIPDYSSYIFHSSRTQNGQLSQHITIVRAVVLFRYRSISLLGFQLWPELLVEAAILLDQ